MELFPNYLALKAYIGFLPCVVYGSLTSQWISATGGKSAPPGVLFVSLQKQWYDLNDEAERIQNTAEARVRALKLPRLFL